MRQVVLDTETTGLSWEKGNRVVEIGCVEILQRRKTGRTFQRYLNPERDMELGAQEVTGLSREFLSDKSRFAEVVEEFLDFIRGAELIIHNANFDIGFLNYELSLAGPHWGRMSDHASVLDTLAMARERFPGQRNSLDALCKRLDVNNKHRTLHGALLDAELLSEVYLTMTAGQGDLGLSNNDPPAKRANISISTQVQSANKVVMASAEEQALHLARLQKIAQKSGNRLQWPEQLP
ncbi:MAG: DNA polymerase III subunit epsilon [Arenimonas sp.]